MEDWELPLATRNFIQQTNAHMNTDFSSNMPDSPNTDERYRYSEQRTMVNPVDSYIGLQYGPANSELSELVDHDFFENLYWGPAGCDNDPLDNPSWSTAPTPRLDTSIAQTAPPDTPIAKQGTDDKKDGVHTPDTEKSNSKRRKRSTSTDHTETDDKEERRMQHIVKDLEKFENQQKEYGKQQLKAIKDGKA